MSTLQQQAKALGDPIRHAIFRHVAPQLRRHGPSAGQVVLAACPFAAAATVDPDTVCRIHLGMAHGVADQTPGLVIDELVPGDPHRADCRLRCHAAA
ncbi:MAG: hypothetical protein ACK5OX_10685 [Desertimonas sp.]